MMNGYYIPIDAALNEARSALNYMSIDDLKKLISNEDEIKQFVRNLNEVEQMEKIKESLKENIKRIATSNLGKEPILRHEKQKLIEVHDRLRRAKEKYQNARGDDDQTDEADPEIIYVQLQTVASNLEQETEQTAEDFFHGEKSEEEVADFERRFVEDRKRAHELKIKADKLHELLQMSQATNKFMLEIRQEQDYDKNEVFRIHQNGFQRDDEAELVDKLRKNSQFNSKHSFVALVDKKIVGHLLFTPIKINYADTSKSILSLALAPISILSEYQRQGIGSKLIEYGLKTLKLQGFSSVIVLGHEHFYPRFGFIPAKKYKIRAPFPLKNENCFMALEFEVGTFPLNNGEGIVQYLPEFGL